MDFKEDEKINENFLVGVLLEGGEEKNVVGSKYFLSRPTKIFSPQNEKKIEGESVIW